MISTDPKKIDELLHRGVSEVISTDELRKKLESGEKLRVKLGIDPTSPNIHLGRSIPLLKLRDFQELGHQIVFIVGNFTAVIGDTSDKDSERPMLTDEAVAENLKHYIEQAGKIIDIDKAEIHYNAEWLSKLTYKEISTQANAFSVAEFIARENIAKRLEAGTRVSLREILYPLMQGYDSVAIKADVELGGSDQRFNCLAGRTLQPHYNQAPQNILLNPLIPGLDGRKMSSSWGNTVNLTDSARDMFGKMMSIPDNLIETYFECATRVPYEGMEHVRALIARDPFAAKKQLAHEVARMYYGLALATEELNWFTNTFSERKIPQDIPVVSISPEETSGFHIVKAFFGEEKSNSEIRRLFEQNAVTCNDDPITFEQLVSPKSGDIWKVGKRTWFKIA